ncbi:MAG: hypothetical protein ABEJ67_00890 [Halanaeroarchaeum sp.]
MRVERSFRGISVRLAKRYLERVGGEVVTENTTEDTARAEGDGWSATVSAETVAIGPSLELTEVTVVFEGEDATVPDVVDRFAKKAVRAGG